MISKKTTIALGVAVALAGGLYLGSGVQAAGTCPLGGDVGPAVPVQLAKSETTQPKAKDCAQDEKKKAESKEGKEQAGQAKPDDGGAPPAIPRIAPDEGC